MARGRKPKIQVVTQTNGFDPDRVKSLVGKIEGHFDEMASEQGTYMKKCRDIRGQIAGVYEEAKAFGIPKKELKTLIDIRKLDRKREAKVEDLEPEQRETFEQIVDAIGGLGDLPLGQAALKRAQRDEEDSAAVDTLDDDDD